jgi:hypothetical protein
VANIPYPLLGFPWFNISFQGSSLARSGVIHSAIPMPVTCDNSLAMR